MTVPNRLAGKVALITGAARARAGPTPCGSPARAPTSSSSTAAPTATTTHYDGPTKDDLEETVRQVEATGRRAIASVVDVRDYDGLSEAMHAGVGELGRLDVVVANAGVLTAARWEITPEQWQETLGVNLTGVFHTMKIAAPILIDQGQGGSIIAIELDVRAARPAVPRRLRGQQARCRRDGEDPRQRARRVPHPRQPGAPAPACSPA